MNDKQRAERILSSLANVNEDLLALLDDVGQSINVRDAAAWEASKTFIDGYHVALGQFETASHDISELIRQKVGIAIQDMPGNRAGIVTKPYDPTFTSRRAHYLGEDFTFTRPVGFTLGEQAFTGVTTWRELLITLCRYLAEQNPQRFANLPENPKLISQQNYPLFRHTPTSEHRKWAPIMPDVYVYVHLSADDTCKWISRLLENFGVPETNLKIYLKRERDAAGDDVA